MTRHWLMKSEPDVFSIEDLRRKPKRTAGWDGVRNYAARNFMKEMRPGDLAFFYNSSTDPAGVAGVMEVAKAAYPDPTQFDPKSDHFDPKATKDKPIWFQVDVRFVEEFPEVIPSGELKGMPELKDMVLFKRGRLSVQPVSPREWEAITGRARVRRATAAPTSRT